MSLVNSLSSIVGVSSTATPVTAALAELDPVTFQETNLQAFQYFPEEIHDNKSPEYANRRVPGGSHPILNFSNGGERVISFSAIFTQDNNPEQQSTLNSLLTGNFSISPSTLTGAAPRKDTVDVASAVAWLRAFTYPEYVNGVAHAPPIAVVYLPNSGIFGHPHFRDSITGVMTQCDVVYEAFHRNGAPRVVVVSLSFIETVQVVDGWQFVGRENILPTMESWGHKDYAKTVIGAPPMGAPINPAQSLVDEAKQLAGQASSITSGLA